MKNVFLSFCLCLLVSISDTSIAEEKPFQLDTMAQLNAQYVGQKWLLVLWSLDCPPCFKELKLIGQLKQQVQDLTIVLVNVDDDDSLAVERTAVIKQFGLSQVTHYAFMQDMATKSRYQIDSQWGGELPRSYFFDQQGKFYGKSGILKNKDIRYWFFAQQSPAKVKHSNQPE